MKKFKFGWGHRYVDMSIVLMGVAIAILVWFIPSFDSDPQLQAFYKEQRELKEKRLAVEAAEARIKRQEEELGIIWVPPPPPKAPSATPAQTPDKPPAKPAPKQKSLYFGAVTVPLSDRVQTRLDLGPKPADACPPKRIPDSSEWSSRWRRARFPWST